MTGEMALHGDVIGVGGIPWKLRAAAKAGRKLVLLPAGNAKDIAQVTDDVLAKLEVVPVKSIREALSLGLEAAVPSDAEAEASRPVANRRGVHAPRPPGQVILPWSAVAAR
jgi:predicted ATP-dependent protease